MRAPSSTLKPDFLYLSYDKIEELKLQYFNYPTLLATLLATLANTIGYPEHICARSSMER